ncbi:MAG: hypothetical protein REI09_14905, partial [Candidatus Dactylopiibacterium sp.]|nr:hypothetical protein [Candidatus Dactylopiibacterium sp.]
MPVTLNALMRIINPRSMAARRALLLAFAGSLLAHLAVFDAARLPAGDLARPGAHLPALAAQLAPALAASPVRRADLGTGADAPV